MTTRTRNGTCAKARATVCQTYWGRTGLFPTRSNARGNRTKSGTTGTVRPRHRYGSTSTREGNFVSKGPSGNGTTRYSRRSTTSYRRPRSFGSFGGATHGHGRNTSRTGGRNYGRASRNGNASYRPTTATVEGRSNGSSGRRRRTARTRSRFSSRVSRGRSGDTTRHSRSSRNPTSRSRGRTRRLFPRFFWPCRSPSATRPKQGAPCKKFPRNKKAEFHQPYKGPLESRVGCLRRHLHREVVAEFPPF